VVRCGGIEQLILASRPHEFGSLGPPGSRPTSSSHDQAPLFGLEFYFIGQLRMLEQHFGHPNALRVSDLNDSGSGDHVITV
jgi:hypothetical protein